VIGGKNALNRFQCPLVCRFFLLSFECLNTLDSPVLIETTPLKKKPKVIKALKKVAKAIKVAKRKREEVLMPAPPITSPSHLAGPSRQPFNMSLGSEKHHHFDAMAMRGGSTAASLELIGSGYNFHMVTDDSSVGEDPLGAMRRWTWKRQIMLLTSEHDMIDGQIKDLKRKWLEEFGEMFKFDEVD